MKINWNSFGTRLQGIGAMTVGAGLAMLFNGIIWEKITQREKGAPMK